MLLFFFVTKYLVPILYYNPVIIINKYIIDNFKIILINIWNYIITILLIMAIGFVFVISRKVY